ncbi:MAG: hypoxanthine phosphoribosyltransferase, partial [Pseudomonadota bacterium]
YAQKLLLERGANRVDCAVLLQKPSRRVEKFEAAFTGFECPDVFVVGYGMDSGHAFRELPFVGVIEG